MILLITYSCGHYTIMAIVLGAWVGYQGDQTVMRCPLCPERRGVSELRVERAGQGYEWAGGQMPYKSQAQAGYFHANEGKKKGITKKVVDEFDKASKGMKLPKRVKAK